MRVTPQVGKLLHILIAKQLIIMDNINNSDQGVQGDEQINQNPTSQPASSPFQKISRQITPAKVSMGAAKVMGTVSATSSIVRMIKLVLKKIRR